MLPHGQFDPILSPRVAASPPFVAERAAVVLRIVVGSLLLATAVADVASPLGSVAVAAYAPIALIAMLLPWRDLLLVAVAASVFSGIGLLLGGDEPLRVEVAQRGAVLATVWIIVAFARSLRAEQALDHLQQLIRQAMEVGGCFAFDWNAQTDRVVRTSNAAQHIGSQEHSAPDNYGKAFFSRVHPDDSRRMQELLKSLTPGNCEYRISYRVALPDGSYANFEECGRAEFDTRGRLVRLWGMAANVTRRSHAEEALRQSEERLRLAIDAAELGTWDYNLATGQLRWNDRQLALMGTTADAFSGTDSDFYERVHPDDRDGVYQAVQRSYRENVDFREEFRIVRPDGTILWLAALGRPMRGADGAVQRMVGIAVDISQRKQSEAALRESEARFREIAENIDQVFYVYSVAEQRRLYTSPYFEKLWGCPPPPEDEMEASLLQIHPDDRQMAAESLRNRLSGNISPDEEVEGRILRPDGTVRWIRDRAFAVRGMDGSVERVVGFIQDITPLKEAERRTRQLETELAHANRVSTLGEMTSGLAHELNQPLAAIENYITTCRVHLKRVADVPPEVEECLDAVTQQVDRAAAIIGRLRDFVMRREPRFSSVDINRVIQEVVQLSRSEFSQHRAQARLELATGLPLLQCDRIQIAQVVLNLLRNALDAMHETEPERRYVVITTRRVDSAVEISVQDAGPGLTDAEVRQMFNPFFTTKEHGMGLGLTICQTLVQAHGGRIWVQSDAPHGTVFRFTLPVS